VFLQNLASTLNSLGLPPNSPSDDLESKDDDDPISGFLSHTPQPLPDLVIGKVMHTSVKKEKAKKWL
jgi:hypothetical protein